jgi:hypothetical protein
MAFSAEEKRCAAARERAMRERVYLKLVAAGKMRQADAEREIMIMKEIEIDYGELAVKERLL